MSEDRIAWLRSHIAVARDFARSLPEDWIQERLEMESRAEQLTDELASEVRTRYALDRSTTLGAVHYTGAVDGLRLKSWAQHELCFEDDRPFGYGWAIYLDDRQYMDSEKGEFLTMAEAERALLASIPEAIEIYRHSLACEKQQLHDRLDLLAHGDKRERIAPMPARVVAWVREWIDTAPVEELRRWHMGWSMDEPGVRFEYCYSDRDDSVTITERSFAYHLLSREERADPAASGVWCEVAFDPPHELIEWLPSREESET